MIIEFVTVFIRDFASSQTEAYLIAESVMKDKQKYYYISRYDRLIDKVKEYVKPQSMHILHLDEDEDEDEDNEDNEDH
jgi:hypothetical protein